MFGSQKIASVKYQDSEPINIRQTVSREVSQMNTFLLKDGVRYLHRKYKNEQELEDFVVEHYQEIFGENTLFFDKRKIKTPSGLGTIPDGFVVDLQNKKWYIVEVELACHHTFNHITQQLYKFSVAVKKNPRNAQKLTKTFSQTIKKDPGMKYLMEIAGVVEEQYEFISDILMKDPEIVVIIDEKTHEVDEACGILPFPTLILEFKTFGRKGVGVGDHIHILDGIGEGKRAPKKKPEESKEIMEPRAATFSKTNNDDFAGKKPKEILFQGTPFSVNVWVDVLMTVCEVMVKNHLDQIEHLFSFRGRKRVYFSKASTELKKPRRIKGTSVFVETNLSANSIVSHSRKIISLFGYSSQDLEIRTMND